MELSGLILNKNRKDYPINSWSFGKNFIISKDGKAILNEGGFDEYANPPMTVIGSIQIADTVVICSNNLATSEIGRLKDGIYTTIVRDSLFNFNLEHPILGVGTYNHKNELIISLTDDYNYPVILNLDNLPFPSGLNTDYSLANKEEFTLVNLFPNVKNPRISQLKVNDTGGNLSSGVYSLSVSYLFDDDSATIWQELSNPIVVTDDVAVGGTNAFNEYDGCEAGTNTSKCIAATFANLDTNFTRFKIAVVAKIGGVVTAYETNVYYYSNDVKEIVIVSLSALNTLSLEEVLVQSGIYTRVRAIALLNNKLHIANLSSIPVIDYQEYANDIEINWYRGDYVALTEVESSYKDSSTLFFRKGWRTGEVGAFYIGLRLKQGGYYGVWHVPGRIANAGDTDIISTNDVAGHPYHHIGLDVKKYQVLDTSTDESGTGLYGKMSYWENTNEQYPAEFPDFAGQNVRHHKFPELAELEGYAEGFITEYTPIVGANETLDFDNAIAYEVSTDNWRVKFNSVTGTPYGTLDTNNTTLVADEPQIVDVSGGITLQKVANGAEIVFIRLYRTHNGITTSEFQTTANFRAATLITVPIVVDNIPLDTNDQLELKIYSDSGEFEAVSTTLEYYCEQTDYVVSAGKVTKPLGIKVSGVVIPEAIRDYVDGWEIFYAERTVNNMLKLGQDIIYGSGWHDAGTKWVTDGNIKVHSFDMLANRLAVTPTYLNRQLEFTVPAAEEDTATVADAESNYTGFAYSENSADTHRILPCKGVNYLPPFIYTASYDNTLREDGYLIQIDPTILSGIGATAERRYLADICAYRTNVYNDYNTQILVSTGYFINVNDNAELQPSQIIYGGDNIIGKYAYKMNYLTGNKNLIPHVVCESISNAGLRHEGKLATEIYFPKSSATDVLSGDALAYGNYYGYNADYNAINNYIQPVIDYPNLNLTEAFPYRIARSLPTQNETVALNWRTFRVNDYYEMSSNKGPINKLTSDTNKKLFIAHKYALFVATIKDYLDTQSSQVYLKEGDLFDREPLEIIPTDYGYIGNQSRFATFICKYGYFTIDIEKAKVYLITDTVHDLGDLDVSEFLEEGLQVTDEMIVGSILADDFEELSYNDDGDAIDYSGSVFYNMFHTDNPFVGTGLSAGFDDANDRVLITNNSRVFTLLEAEGGIIPDIDSSPVPIAVSTIQENVVSIAQRSFTMSYNFKHKYWVAFHDYLVNHYITTRTNLLGVVNHGNLETGDYLANIYRLNSKTVYAKYPNTIMSTYVDMIMDNSNNPEKLVESIAYDCNLIGNNITLWDKTLSKAMLYTAQQCTGEVVLVIKTWANQLIDGNVKNVKGIWVLNDFKDRSVDTNISFIDEEGDVILDTLEGEEVDEIIYGRQYVVAGVTSASDYIQYNAPGAPEVPVYYTYNGQQIPPINGVTNFTKFGTAIVKNFKKWYEKSNIYTNFAVIRLKYDNTEQLKLKINNVLLNLK